MKASVEQEDRKFRAPTPGRSTALEAAQERPHPASWAALKARLAQETAARELAEALHAKKAQQLEEALKRITRLEALILGAHLSRGEELDGACILLDEEGQRLHGCAGGTCDAEPE